MQDLMQIKSDLCAFLRQKAYKGTTFFRDMHNAGKGKQPVNTHKWSKSSHDRWVIIGDTLYHCGHSVKDLGKKLSAIMKMDWNPDVVLKEVR